MKFNYSDVYCNRTASVYEENGQIRIDISRNDIVFTGYDERYND